MASVVSLVLQLHLHWLCELLEPGQHLRLPLHARGDLIPHLCVVTVHPGHLLRGHEGGVHHLDAHGDLGQPLEAEVRLAAKPARQQQGVYELCEAMDRPWLQVMPDIRLPTVCV